MRYSLSLVLLGSTLIFLNLVACTTPKSGGGSRQPATSDTMPANPLPGDPNYPANQVGSNAPNNYQQSTPNTAVPQIGYQYGNPYNPNDIAINGSQFNTTCYQADANICNIESSIFQLTNQERAKQGLPALQLSPQLSFVAREASRGLTQLGYLTHDGFPEKRLALFMATFNYQINMNAENMIMRSDNNPTEMVQDWMASNGHRRNILNTSSRVIGVGLVQSVDGRSWYATQIFGR